MVRFCHTERLFEAAIVIAFQDFLFTSHGCFPSKVAKELYLTEERFSSFNFDSQFPEQLIVHEQKKAQIVTRVLPAPFHAPKLIGPEQTVPTNEIEPMPINKDEIEYNEKEHNKKQVRFTEETKDTPKSSHNVLAPVFGIQQSDTQIEEVVCQFTRTKKDVKVILQSMTKEKFKCKQAKDDVVHYSGSVNFHDGTCQPFFFLSAARIKNLCGFKLELGGETSKKIANNPGKIVSVTDDSVSIQDSEDDFLDYDRYVQLMKGHTKTIKELAHRMKGFTADDLRKSFENLAVELHRGTA